VIGRRLLAPPGPATDATAPPAPDGCCCRSQFRQDRAAGVQCVRGSYVASGLCRCPAEPVDQECLGHLARSCSGDRVGPGVQVAHEPQPACLHPLQALEQAGHRVAEFTVGQ
jgi:hypothetical protein